MEASVAPLARGMPERWRSSSIGPEFSDDGDNDSLDELDRELGSSTSVDSQSSDFPRIVVSAMREVAPGSAIAMLSPLQDLAPMEDVGAAGGGPLSQLGQQGGSHETVSGGNRTSGLSSSSQSLVASTLGLTTSSQSLALSSVPSATGLGGGFTSSRGSPEKQDIAMSATVLPPARLAAEFGKCTDADEETQAFHRAFDLLTESEDEDAAFEVIENGDAEQQEGKEISIEETMIGETTSMRGRVCSAITPEISAGSVKVDSDAATDYVERRSKHGVSDIPGQQQAVVNVPVGFYAPTQFDVFEEGLQFSTDEKIAAVGHFPGTAPSSQESLIISKQASSAAPHLPLTKSSQHMEATKVQEGDQPLYSSDDVEDESDAELDGPCFEPGDNSEQIDPPILNPQPKSRKPTKNYADDGAAQRVKFLCSYGGLIVPRPGDGKLRYVGGETRIMVFNRNIQYFDLMFKMREHYGHALTLKYQLPNEDLDALVSVSSDEDLKHMMEEYDQLKSRCGTDSQARLRVFLFNAVEAEPQAQVAGSGNVSSADAQYAQYVGALNRGYGGSLRFNAPFKPGIEEGEGQVADQRERQLAGMDHQFEVGTGRMIGPLASQLPPVHSQHNGLMQLTTATSPPIEQLPPSVSSMAHSRSAALLLDIPPLDTRSSAHGSPRVNSPRQLSKGVASLLTGPATLQKQAVQIPLPFHPSLLPVSNTVHMTGAHGMQLSLSQKIVPPVHRAVSSERLSGPPSRNSSKPDSPPSPGRSRRSPPEQVLRLEIGPSLLSMPDPFEALQARHLWEQQSPAGSAPGTPFSEDMPIGIAPPSPRRQRELEKARVMAHELLGGHNEQRWDIGPAGVMEGRPLVGVPSQHDLQHVSSQQELPHFPDPPPDIRRQMNLPRLNVGPVEALRKPPSGPPSPRLYSDSPHLQIQRQHLPDQLRGNQFQRSEVGMDQAHYSAGFDIMPGMSRAPEHQLEPAQGGLPLSAQHWNLPQGGDHVAEQIAVSGSPLANRQQDYPVVDGWKDSSGPPSQPISSGRGAGGLVERAAGWQGGLGREEDPGGGGHRWAPRQLLSNVTLQHHLQSKVQPQHNQQFEGSYSLGKGGGLQKDWNFGGDFVIPQSAFAVRGAQSQQHLQQQQQQQQQQPQQHHMGRVVPMQDQQYRHPAEPQGHHLEEGAIQSQAHRDQHLGREENSLYSGDERFRADDHQQLPIGDSVLGGYGHPLDSRMPPGHVGNYGAQIVDNVSEHIHQTRASAPASPHFNGLFQDQARWQPGGVPSGQGAGPVDGRRMTDFEPGMTARIDEVQYQAQQQVEGMGGYLGQGQFESPEDRQYLQRSGKLEQRGGLHGRQMELRGGVQKGGQGAPYWVMDEPEVGIGDGAGPGRGISAGPASTMFPLQHSQHQQPEHMGRFYDDVADSHPMGARRPDLANVQPYDDEPSARAQQGGGINHGAGHPGRSGFPEGAGSGRPGAQPRRLSLHQDMGTTEGGALPGQVLNGQTVGVVGNPGGRAQRDPWTRNEGMWEGTSDREGMRDGTREGPPAENWGGRFLDRMGRGGVTEQGGGNTWSRPEWDPRLQGNSDMLPGFTEVDVGQSGDEIIRDFLHGRPVHQLQGRGPQGHEPGLPNNSGALLGLTDAMGRGGHGRNPRDFAGGHQENLPGEMMDLGRQRQLAGQDDRQFLPVGNMQGPMGVRIGFPAEGHPIHDMPPRLQDGPPLNHPESRGILNDRFGGLQIQTTDELPPGLKAPGVDIEMWERTEGSRRPHFGADSRGNAPGLLPGVGLWAMQTSGGEVQTGDDVSRSAPRSRRGSDERKQDVPSHGGGQKRVEEEFPASRAGSGDQGFHGVGGESQQGRSDGAGLFYQGARTSGAISHENLSAQEWPLADLERQQNILQRQQLAQENSQTSEITKPRNQSELPDMIQWGEETVPLQTSFSVNGMATTLTNQDASAARNLNNGLPLLDSLRVSLPEILPGKQPTQEFPPGMHEGKVLDPGSRLSGLGHLPSGYRPGPEPANPVDQSSTMVAPGQPMMEAPGYERNLGQGATDGGNMGAAAGSGMGTILDGGYGPIVVGSMTKPGQFEDALGSPSGEPDGFQTGGYGLGREVDMEIGKPKDAGVGDGGRTGALSVEGATSVGSPQQADIYGADKYGAELQASSKSGGLLQNVAVGFHRPVPVSQVPLAEPETATAGSVGREKRGGLSLQLANAETLANDVAFSVLGTSPSQESTLLLRGNESPSHSGEGSPVQSSTHGAVDVPQPRTLLSRKEAGSRAPSRRADRHVAEDMAASVLGGSPLGKSPLNLELGGRGGSCSPSKPGEPGGSMLEMGPRATGGRMQEPSEVPEEVQRAFEEGATPRTEIVLATSSPVPKAEASETEKSDFATPGRSKAAGPKALAAEAEAVAAGLQTIPTADLEELRELGSGTYGTVFHGKWRGTDVAIKRIKTSVFQGHPSEQERLIADFWREACTLGGLHHPNVVAFYGVVKDHPDGSLATVTEYMVNGSLKQVLQKKDRSIDRRKRILIGMDAAFGMEYLHGKNIVHFDLKCDNLLVNLRDAQRPICKVGDLGLSKVKHKTMVSGGVRGTLPWMAPELLDGRSALVTEKVDVFSFGICMWELLTGEEPYASMHYGAIIGGILNNTLRPPIPSWCDPAWKSLMERCWSGDPAERPSFQEVTNELRAMALALQPNKP